MSKHMNIKNSKIIKYIFDIMKRCSLHDSYASAGYTAYKLIISAVPMAIVAAILFSGVPAIENWLMDTLQPILAPQAYAFVKYISELAGEYATTPLLSVGTLTMLYSVSSGIYTLMKGVSIAEDGRCIFEKRGFIKNRFLAIILTVIIFTVIFCCGMLSLEMQYYGEPTSNIGRAVLSYVLVMVMLVTMLMFIYKISPVGKIRWFTAFKRALLSSVLISGLTFAMNIYYTELSDPGNIYGAFAGLAIIMIWLYSISFCILLAGEF